MQPAQPAPSLRLLPHVTISLDTIAPRPLSAEISFQPPLRWWILDHMSKGFGESDFAQVQAERANNQTIQQVLERDREQAKHARDRQAQGAYGICEDCGRKIGDERLEALPDATRCVICQVESEAGNR